MRPRLSLMTWLLINSDYLGSTQCLYAENVHVRSSESGMTHLLICINTNIV